MSTIIYIEFDKKIFISIDIRIKTKQYLRVALIVFNLIDQIRISMPTQIEAAEYELFPLETLKAQYAVKIIQHAVVHELPLINREVLSLDFSSLGDLHKFINLKKNIFKFSNQNCSDCFSPMTPWQNNAFKIQIKELDQSLKRVKQILERESL